MRANKAEVFASLPSGEKLVRFAAVEDSWPRISAATGYLASGLAYAAIGCCTGSLGAEACRKNSDKRHFPRQFAAVVPVVAAVPAVSVVPDDAVPVVAALPLRAAVAV